MSQPGQLERRREARTLVDLLARLRPQCASPTEVVVSNLSGHGCGLAPAGRLREGDTVWLRLPGLESWEAVVVWRSEVRIGLEFTKPLHPAVVARLGGR